MSECVRMRIHRRAWGVGRTLRIIKVSAAVSNLIARRLCWLTSGLFLGLSAKSSIRWTWCSSCLTGRSNHVSVRVADWPQTFSLTTGLFLGLSAKSSIRSTWSCLTDRSNHISVRVADANKPIFWNIVPAFSHLLTLVWRGHVGPWVCTGNNPCAIYRFNHGFIISIVTSSVIGLVCSCIRLCLHHVSPGLWPSPLFRCNMRALFAYYKKSSTPPRLNVSMDDLPRLNAKIWCLHVTFMAQWHICLQVSLSTAGSWWARDLHEESWPPTDTSKDHNRSVAIIPQWGGGSGGAMMMAVSDWHLPYNFLFPYDNHLRESPGRGLHKKRRRQRTNRLQPNRAQVIWTHSQRGIAHKMMGAGPMSGCFSSTHYMRSRTSCAPGHGQCGLVQVPFPRTLQWVSRAWMP